MMDHRKQNPAARASANRVQNIKGFAKLDVENHSEAAPESLAIRSVARRFRITIPHARVVCELCGLGGAA